MLQTNSQDQQSLEKFSDRNLTAQGEKRAWVSPTNLDTVWINTGTLCNLSCENCYIESSPRNDRLVYFSRKDLVEYLEEIQNQDLKTKMIGFTGGEPFLNPEMLPMLRDCLEAGFSVLMLTNAMQPMQKKQEQLLELNREFGDRLMMRVSVDHYLESTHELERGKNSWKFMLRGLKWLSDFNFSISVAGRTLSDEGEDSIRAGFARLFKEEAIKIDALDPMSLLVFAEMDPNADTPEITTACWDILGKKPEDIMCASSRMIVKRKGEQKSAVVACTLLPYSPEFEMGTTLQESLKPISLNHPYCSKFCVLGGSSCAPQ